MLAFSTLLAAGLFSSIAAATNSTAGQPPQCGTHCMSIKLTEAANWFGPGDLTTYCAFPNFLQAYDRCVDDNCPPGDVALSKQAGVAACGNVRQSPGGQANGSATASGANATAPHSSNSTGGAATNRTGLPADLPAGANTTSGATLNNTLVANATTTGQNPTPPSRFSSAVSNASQAAAASAASNLSPALPPLLVTVSSVLAVSLLMSLSA